MSDSVKCGASSASDLKGPRELRLALILNGGVSLAVWMGGVVQEIDTLRRASRGGDAPLGASEAETHLYAEWRRICHEKQIERVVVDVIAGTSAGGLNGTLLAAAIASGNPLSGLRDVWVDTGQLKPGALIDPGEAGIPSVLDGKFFECSIRKQVRRLSQPSSHGDENELTLFITATSLSKSDRTMLDSSGSEFSEADNRRRYRFRHGTEQNYVSVNGEWGFRPDDINHFADGDTLTLAARGSASFPVAFAPVPESAALALRRVWPPWAPASERSWLADGGILDDAPFEPVLDAIAQRHTHELTERAVCYIVPSDAEAGLGRTDQGASLFDPDGRPAWTTVLAKTLSLPNQANFRNDIEMLDGTFTSAGPDEAQALFDQTWTDPAQQIQLTDAAMALFPVYQRNKYLSGIAEVRAHIAEQRAQRDLVPSAYQNAWSTTSPWVPSALQWTSGQPWQWGLSTAERVTRLLHRYLRDVPTGADEGARRAISDVVAKIRAVRKAVLRELTSLGTPADCNWDQLLTTVLNDLDVPAQLGCLVAKAETAFIKAVGGSSPTADPVSATQVALNIEVVRYATTIVAKFSTIPPFSFYRFGPDIACGLAPQAEGQSKLYGTRLMHFGAFGKREWRTSDWVWGRLDGVAHLGRLLGLPQAEVDQLQMLVLAAENQTECGLAQAVSKVSQETGEGLLDKLREPSGSTPSTAAQFVSAFLRFLRGDGKPFTPPRDVRLLGASIDDNIALSRPPGLEFKQLLLRIVAFLPRRMFWRRVNEPKPGG
jgi:hypothetical protein